MAKRRRGQWFGDSQLITLQAGNDVAEVIQILPPANALESIRDIVFERVIIGFQNRRVLTSVVEGCAWMVWKGAVITGTTTPLQALTPLSQLDFSWADKDIMQYGVLPVPPIFFDGVANAITQELTSSMVDFNVKRSIHRANEGIFLVVRADNGGVVKCNVSWRLYYTYAS